MDNALTLYDLNSLIKSTIEGSFPDTVLVTAEIASCTVKGHCYMTLVDKEDDTIRAEMGAVIWANRYNVIASAFSKATGTKLSKGIKILFSASVRFHERYGLKLTITNIDPSYTIGEMAVKRKEILDRLAREGLIEKNRELDFPLVPQRIGIISSSTAAGYEDLMNHLTNNAGGYCFYTCLYDSLMQGDRAESSILDALRRCRRDAHDLDIVVIVRGGGGQTDLHCFDSYALGSAIAQMPVPVISGIGHQRDITVVDEVSGRRAKTPTAAADMIITAAADFEGRLDAAGSTLVHETARLTSGMKELLMSLSSSLRIAAGNRLLDYRHALSVLVRGLGYVRKLVQNEKQKLTARESNINHLNPKNVMKRGYSITYHNGGTVTSVSEVSAGDRVRTVLYEGELASTVESRKKGRKTL